MAVQFKVPKSPSRDIAATDTFMGVDLTNTGANIDGIRSPHAPNMVRLVPGKVRKRMGYYKEVLFGTKTNVNFAKDTSAKEREIIITPQETSGFIKIYDYIQEIPEGTTNYYIEFDYTAEHDFMIVSEFNVVEAAQPDEEGNYPHYSGIAHSTYEDGVCLWSEVPQEIYIKNFSFMLAKDTSYEWSPAPKYFVERETNDPVYGVYFLRNGADSFEGDRVVNVNRILNTTDEFTEVTLSAGGYYEFDDFRMAELPGGAKVYIDLDYQLDLAAGKARIVFQNPLSGVSSDNYIELDPAAQTTHATFVMNNLHPNDLGIFYTATGGVTGTLRIKNFSMCYEKDENYAWSPAPEDKNEKFHLTDVYNIQPKNYSVLDSASDNSSSFSSSYTKTFTIATVDSCVDGNTFLTFELTAGTEENLSSIHVNVKNNNNTLIFRDWNNTDSIDKQTYSLFLGTVENGFVKTIEVTYNVSGSTKAYTFIENIKLQKYSIKEDFHVSSKWYLYHVGKEFYLRSHDSNVFTSVYQDANEHISRGFQLNNNYYIIDGKDIYKYSIQGGGLFEVIGKDNAYIPIVTEAKEPTGGGVANEALNMLQPGFIETFLSTATSKKYQLSFKGLDDTKVIAWVLDSKGNWVAKTEGTHFTVNRDTGKITFTTAPGEGPISGEPNVKIQAYRTIDDYRDRVVKCTVGTLFGIGGATNRIFISGNPDHPNWDFYCQMDDPTYFPDIAYSVMGSEQSAIKGYAIISNYLATFKDGFDQSQSVFIREGDMLKLSEEETATSEPVFKLINTLQGEGVAASYSFGYLQTEPVFLTKAGIYAITEQDITGEKYSQNRSFYLDGKLRKEENLENAIATVYDNQYILALNGKLYVLDGLQATRTDKSEPYATRQYAGFLCEGIPATCLWTDDTVCFGTNDGKVCKFYTDVDALSSYNDDGKPIYSCWETPDLDGKLFYKNKTFRYMAVRLMAAIKTSVKLYSRRFGIWTLNDESAWTFIKSQNAIGTSLDFNNLDFNLFSFSADTTERVIHTKLRVKKVDKARFRVENGELDEPFGIFDLALEYIESGNYKG